VNPAQFVRNAKAALRDAGSPKVALGSRRFFKESDTASFYGVATPELRRLEREAFRQIKGRWELPQAVAFAQSMIEAKQLEAKAFGLLTLSRFKRSYEPKLLRTAEQWLENDHCANWATVDALCPLVLTPLVTSFPELIPRVERWVRSKNLWVRRASAVIFVPLARRGERLGSAYRVSQALFGDSEDLIHKATGWLLRECGRTNRQRLTRFLLRYGPRIPRTTVRYAIERHPEAQRKKLLVQTAR
jgi:3-methyladenine DNA glycosylase AlkD